MERSKEKIQLSYGWQECEDGIYHAFEAEDVNYPTGDDEMAAHLAEELDTTVDDTRFNWNQMEIALPESVVKRIRCEALAERVNKLCKAGVDPAKAGKYIVQLIGTDLVKTIADDGYTAAPEFDSYEAAMAELRKVYQEILEAHNPCVFDEYEFDEERGEFTLSGEEYFQYGIVLPLNPYTGYLSTIRKISEAADSAATFANCYEYDATCMQDVYDKTHEIEVLCDTLRDELANAMPVEMSYVDLLTRLQRDVENDHAMPNEAKKKADLLLAQLEGLLWPYSA